MLGLLGLGANALKAFDLLGLGAELRKKGRLVTKFTICDQKGRPIIETDLKQPDLNSFTIHRADLQYFLLSQVPDKTKIHLGKELVDISLVSDGVKLYFSDGSSHFTNYLIVANGINSTVRRKLVPESSPRYAGYTCWRAVINNSELNISKTSETWGTKGRFGIVPLADNKIYWFACINYPEMDENAKAFTINDLKNVFKDYHDPIPKILNETENDNLIWNDIYDLKPLQKFAYGRIILVGDAAHATTPNMGQGACQAIEDAVVLAKYLLKNVDYEKAFEGFEQERLKRTKWIINSSRRIGEVAQISNNMVALIRNSIFRMMPPGINNNQYKKLYNIELTL